MKFTDIEKDEIQNLLYGYDCEYIPQLKEATDKIFNYLQEKVSPFEARVMPANGGWNDLTKTLPEVGKQVLVFNKVMKTYNLCELVEWDNKRQWYDYECTQDFNMYDYWMELPSKP